MGTGTPKAWQTIWGQDAIKAERDRSADAFQYSKEELERVTQVKRCAAPPDGCSPEIIAAPARGSMTTFREGYWHETDSGGEWRHVPYRSGCPGRTRDIFDTMTDQATRRGGDGPFTAAQVGAARDYRDLHEAVQSAGVKCSSTFDDKVRGQGRVDFMDAYIRDSERLGLFVRAIGDGVAKDTRRKGPAIEGAAQVGDVQLRQIGRRLITVRRLVDDVCIGERALSQVLEAHGWRATGKNRMTLRAALCAALGRMQGV